MKMKHFTLAVILISVSCCQNLVENGTQFHHELFTIDTHCDTPLHMADTTFDIGVRHIPGGEGSGKIDLPRMRDGGLDAEFFAAFVGQRARTAENYTWAQNRVDHLISLVKDMCKRYPEMIAFADKPEDAYENNDAGLLSAYIGIENGFALGMDIENVKRYYDMGVRYITLCHTSNNDICDSSTDKKGPEHDGLSDYGRQVVREMNRLGMIVDVSHISDKAFFDVIGETTAPVIASHSSVRAVCDNPRNLTDDMITALAENGGVIQICIFTDYVKTPAPNTERDSAFAALWNKYDNWEKSEDPEIRKKLRREYHEIDAMYPKEKATVADLVDHIDHVVELVGIDHVGIGTDFDGGGGIDGCDEVSEMPNITIELLRRGYSKEDIEKIWGANFMRVFREVERIANSTLATETQRTQRKNQTG